jgi:hypothetical protein
MAMSGSVVPMNSTVSIAKRRTGAPAVKQNGAVRPTLNWPMPLFRWKQTDPLASPETACWTSTRRVGRPSRRRLVRRS